MNSIPSIGPDSAVAPRSGSASPQTPAQQRADAAPTVIDDSSSARADPGVLLKVVPPARGRDDGTAIRAEGSMAQDLDLFELGRQAVSAIGLSAKEADLAVAKRIEAAFEALPADVQEAIRQASSPAIAHLLRLAAMTREGIKNAPAIFAGPDGALADSPQAAALQLHESLKGAAPFQMAVLLRDALLEGNTASAAAARQFLMGLRAAQNAAQNPAQSTANPQGAATGPHAHEASQAQGAQLLAELFQSLAAGGALGQLAQRRFSQAALAPAGPPQGQAQALPEASAKGMQASMAAPLHDTLERAPALTPQTLQVAREAQADSPLLTSSAAGQAPGSAPNATNATNATNAQAAQAATLQAAAALLSPAQTEQAVRDGLKMVMDGRMLWTGQFTPGVWMALERSDAWRADREHPGGLQKGTSLRFKLELPQLGVVEIRALGFGGQVSARVQADPAVTPKLAEALPALQERLRHKGLAGAQVLIESS